MGRENGERTERVYIRRSKLPYLISSEHIFWIVNSNGTSTYNIIYVLYGCIYIIYIYVYLVVVPVFIFVLSHLDGALLCTHEYYNIRQITAATQPAGSGVRNPSGIRYIPCRVMGTRVYYILFRATSACVWEWCSMCVQFFFIFFFFGYCPAS